MQKIKWDLEKERFLPETKSVMICNHCGWLIQNPRPIDGQCDNCRKNYKDTNSEIQLIKKEK